MKKCSTLSVLRYDFHEEVPLIFRAQKMFSLGMTDCHETGSPMRKTKRKKNVKEMASLKVGQFIVSLYEKQQCEYMLMQKKNEMK